MTEFMKSSPINDYDYSRSFWNKMRRKDTEDDKRHLLVSDSTGGYALPHDGFVKMNRTLEKTSVFRQLATVMRVHGHQYKILSKDQDDMAAWIPASGEFPIYDGMDDFTVKTIGSHKVGAFLKMDEDFVYDASFSFEDYLIQRLAKNFGDAETAAFISGTGEEMPTGILAEENGAQVGVTATALTYDDVVKLYFSVKPEYREKGVWLMNDETAYTLRTIKDADGNYIWNHANDTILGKKVILTRHMPGAAAGSKPIAFGDFSYYWIVTRKDVTVRTIIEKFIVNGRIGYLAYEFLDGKLVRPDAIKVLRMSDTAA